MKKRLVWAAAILFALLVATPFLLYLSLPRLIRPFLEAKLAALGCEDSRVRAREITANGARIEEIHCLLPKRGELWLRDMEISYALSELYAGRIGRVFVREAEVSLLPGDPESKASIPIPESFFAFVPLSELEISRIVLLYARPPGKAMKVEAGLRARFHALSIEGELRAASPELKLEAGFVLSSAQASLLIEKGSFHLPDFQVSVPGKTRLDLKSADGALGLTLSKEIAASAMVKKAKHEFRVRGLSAELREKEAKAEFQAAYRDLPWFSLALGWRPEKEEIDFEWKPVTLSLAKIFPLAMGFVEGKKPPLEIQAGELTVSGSGSASAGKAPFLLRAKVSGELKGAGGSYGEHKFEGIHFPLSAEFRNGAIQVAPADLRVAEFNPGLPVKNIQAKMGFEVKGGGADIHVTAASAEIFSGRALVPEFSLDTGHPGSKFQVELQALSLGEVITLQKQEGISGSGTLDGMLPIELGKHGILVRDGRVRARPPGGYIAYEAGEGLRAAEGNPGLKLAVDVLRNLQYQVLEGKVDYQISGDMNVALRLEGHNPDWSGGRPVHFNFTVSENLPKLLKSLRIADETGSALEKRMQER